MLETAPETIQLFIGFREIKNKPIKILSVIDLKRLPVSASQTFIQFSFSQLIIYLSSLL